MTKNIPAILLVCICALGTISWSHAAPETNSDPNSTASKQDSKHESQPENITSKYWEKADQAKAEAQEAKALAEKAKTESELQAFLRDRKTDEALSKARLETAMSFEATKKAENEAKRMEAIATIAEAQLRTSKAQTQLQEFTNTVEFYLDAKTASAKTERAEAMLMLAKTLELVHKTSPQ